MVFEVIVLAEVQLVRLRFVGALSRRNLFSGFLDAVDKLPPNEEAWTLEVDLTSVSDVDSDVNYTCMSALAYLLAPIHRRPTAPSLTWRTSSDFVFGMARMYASLADVVEVSEFEHPARRTLDVEGVASSIPGILLRVRTTEELDDESDIPEARTHEAS